ncbi:MAG: chromate transporter [Dorea sp.]
MNKKNLKKSLHLFAFFFKIGCFTFGGGWSILAQMEQEFVDKRKVITKEELLELVAVGKSVPGIMITNIAMLFGYQMCGWFGGVCAVLGITCPAVLILSLVTYGYAFFKSNYWCHLALEGIRAAVVPIIGCAALSLGKEIFQTGKGRFLCAAAFLLCVFTEISNITLVLIGVAAAFSEMAVRKQLRGGDSNGIS